MCGAERCSLATTSVAADGHHGGRASKNGQNRSYGGAISLLHELGFFEREGSRKTKMPSELEHGGLFVGDIFGFWVLLVGVFLVF